MIVLGIDSSTKTASVSICDNDKVIVDFTLNHTRTHSEKLLEMIDMALKISKLDISDIDAFAVTKGPGSFTGLRIGLATIKGLCHALNKPCYLTSTISALFESVNNEYSNDIIYAPIMDARRNEVYAGAFLNGERIIEDSALPISDFIDKLKEFEFKKIVFTGDGVYSNIEIIKEKLNDKCSFAPEHLINGCGAGVIKSAIKENNKVTYDNILPSYLRPSQAERMKL